MKHKLLSISSFVAYASVLSLLIAPAAFARTPYNALAKKLPSNTSKGVYNTTDPLQSDTQVSGVIWGKNGSTFIIRLPKDDAGYNVLFSGDTIITKNGVATSSKSIVKGVAVTVTGTLDTSTYTIKATTVELGKTVSASAKPVPITTKETADTSPKLTETPKTPTNTQPQKSKTISTSLKQGSHGPDVTLLQEKLVRLGFLAKESATGYYGPQTTKAVQAFQKKHKLSPVGTVGSKTLSLLNQ
ncbi:MAG: peptidoglycan-binding domain-containing protein [Candidatus Uhrbacteria bacterium]|nr:peptidoglycan-binding domain-containing protein [Candidatus Uhrbacteria bacterium]